MASPLGSDVLVVSGLPRSGTSLVMQLLAAGGVPLLTDGVRRADDHNPEGYFEFEAVKGTNRDARWLEHAPGKAVKMVLPLLELLPPSLPARVILATRDLREVALSQARMVAASNAEVAPADDLEAWAVRLGDELDEGRRWLSAHPAIKVLEVDYGEIVARPLDGARRICAFVGRGLDAAAMALTVDPALYRARC